LFVCPLPPLPPALLRKFLLWPSFVFFRLGPHRVKRARVVTVLPRRVASSHSLGPPRIRKLCRRTERHDRSPAFSRLSRVPTHHSTLHFTTGMWRMSDSAGISILFALLCAAKHRYLTMNSIVGRWCVCLVLLADSREATHDHATIEAQR